MDFRSLTSVGLLALGGSVLLAIVSGVLLVVELHRIHARRRAYAVVAVAMAVIVLAEVGWLAGMLSETFALAAVAVIVIALFVVGPVRVARLTRRDRASAPRAE